MFQRSQELNMDVRLLVAQVLQQQVLIEQLEEKCEALQEDVDDIRVRFDTELRAERDRSECSESVAHWNEAIGEALSVADSRERFSR